MENAKRVFLQMRLNKALEKDKHGNILFTVEASNENLDLEGQRVLQNALLGSKSHFLKNGVISKDHLHRKLGKGGAINEEFVIGEPVAVYAEGPSTMVRGKLYAGNPYARRFIELLDQGSSRVKASIGGLLPLVSEAGEIVSVLWDDLALTLEPVNPTVAAAGSGPALAKSLAGAQFVKALAGGFGTEAAEFEGGRALQRESVSGAVGRRANKNGTGGGKMNGQDWDELDEDEEGFDKSGIEDDDGFDKSGIDGGDDDDDDELEPEDVEALEELDEREAALEEAEKSLARSLAKAKSAGAAAKAMARENALLKKRVAEQGRVQKSLAARLEKLEAAPQPLKSALAAMAKSRGEGSRVKPFSAANADKMRGEVLAACKAGDIDIYAGGRFETQINKSLANPAHRFSKEFEDFVIARAKGKE